MSFISDIFSKAGGSLLDGVSSILKDVIADPTKKAEIAQKIAELNQQVTLANIAEAEKELEAQTAQIQAVNQTMQAEDKSEHWLVWCWRPVIGLTLAAILINNYIVLPYLVKYGAQKINIDTEAWMAIGAVLGIASWGRSQTQINNSK